MVGFDEQCGKVDRVHVDGQQKDWHALVVTSLQIEGQSSRVGYYVKRDVGVGVETMQHARTLHVVGIKGVAERRDAIILKLLKCKQFNGLYVRRHQFLCRRHARAMLSQWR